MCTRPSVPKAIVLASLGLLGCAIDEQTNTELPIVSKLLHEARGLADLWSLQSLILFAVLVTVATLAAKVVSIGVRLAWRLGVDTDRRLSSWELLVRIAIALAVLGFVGHTVASIAPLSFSIAVILLVAVAGFAAVPYVQAAIVGAYLTLHRKLRVGDRIEVAGHEGIVREIGMTLVEIRKSDGSIVLIPTRLLGEHPVDITRVHNSVPVSVSMRLPHRATPTDIEQARRVGLLSPHRVAGSPVLVETGTEPTDIVLVVRIWSEKASRIAAAELATVLSRDLGSTPMTPTSTAEERKL